MADLEQILFGVSSPGSFASDESLKHESSETWIDTFRLSQTFAKMSFVADPRSKSEGPAGGSRQAASGERTRVRNTGTFTAEADDQFHGPILVADSQAITEICQLRVRVWRQTGTLAEDAFPDGQWRDAIDETCKHWCVTRNGEIVAAARWSLHASLEDLSECAQYARHDVTLTGPISQPARVVVCPTARGRGLRGLASKLLDVQDAESRRAGARYAVRQAAPGMVPLLRRRGWQIVGPATPDPRFPGVQFQVSLFRYD